MSIGCASAAGSPLQSLLVLAPGRAVPCQLTVTVWPLVVGTVTWSWAADEPGNTATRAQRTAIEPTVSCRRVTMCPETRTAYLRVAGFQTLDHLAWDHQGDGLDGPAEQGRRRWPISSSSMHWRHHRRST